MTGSRGVSPLAIVAAVLLPPLGIFLDQGVTKHFWFGLVLTLFFWVPGILFALYILLRNTPQRTA